ncbi:MAG TPA: TetR/AcrR family transcriptional regulator [Rudaea sp.]
MAAKSARKPRTPGRPSASGVDLRSRLLDTALKRFAADGIEATPLRAIAKSAGVTPALLHYYFGSKPQLIEALVAERLLPVVAEVRAAAAGDYPDVSRLAGAFVGAVFEVVARHPWFPPLWAREVLSDGGALRELLVTRIASKTAPELEQRFRAAQERGEINPDLDPRLLVVSLIGLTLFAAASAPIWRRVFKADDIDADVLREHTLALLARGLRRK